MPSLDRTVRKDLCMSQLNYIDYGVMGVYLMVLVCLGFYLKRKASASLEDYLLGGRKIPWWLMGVSGMASFLDITGTVLIVSLLYMLGPQGLFIEFRGGAVLVLVIYLLWAGKWHRRSGCYTGAEWMSFRFGNGAGGNAARILKAVSEIIFTTGMLIYMAKGVGTFLSMFLPFTPAVCSTILIGVAAVYTMISGFYGVVYTDLFQSFIILIAVVGISALALINVGDIETVKRLSSEVVHNPHWLSSFPHWKVPMPKGYETYHYLSMFAFFYLLRNIFFGMGTGDDPKYFGARSDRECGTLTFLWTWLMMFRWPMMMGFAVLGLFLVKEKFPDQRVLQQAEITIKEHIVEKERPGMVLDLEKQAQVDVLMGGSAWADDVEGAVEEVAVSEKKTQSIEELFGPDWHEALKRCAEQKAIVREIIPKKDWDRTTFMIADSASTDSQYSELRPALKRILKEDQWRDKLKMVSYEGNVNPEKVLPAVLFFMIPRGLRGLLLIALLAASMSTFDSTVNRGAGFFTRDLYQRFFRPKAGDRELIFSSWFFIAAVAAAGLVLGNFVENINDIWDWIAMGLGGGLVVPFFLRFYWWRYNGAGFAVGMAFGLTGAIGQRILAPDLDPRLQFVSILSMGLAGSILGTYLSRPTDRAVLEHFYKTTRPFGLWKPLKGVLPPDEHIAMKAEHRNDIMAVPFTLGWQVTLFLLPMQLIIHSYNAFFITLGIFLFCLGGMYIFWYRHLPPGTQQTVEDTK